MIHQRQSNIELLRILAIFFVLICHAGGRILGLPTLAEIENSTIQSLTRIFIDCIGIAGVDIFILISGWFGIYINKKRLGKFIYQVLFLLWGIYTVAILLGDAILNFQGIRVSLALTNEYWFIYAYLGLYILSPVLNSFVEKANKRQFQLWLIAFYAFQCYYCWTTGTIDYYNGYSITFFCGLYLTARYLRIYPINTFKNLSILIYFSCTLIICLIATLALWKFGNAARMLRYDNPLVIIASCSLLFSFTKLNIKSNLINWTAQSCFAVYIIHFNPFVFPYFSQIDQYVFDHTSGIFTILAIGIFLVMVFLTCTIVDQLRILTWKLFFK